MKRIFIVEDEAVIAIELSYHLQDFGFEVAGHSARGEGAMQAIHDARPDLVLMDINLGGGMDGLDVAERVRDSLDVPIVFLTAYSDEQLTARAARTGSFGYLTKPFDPLVLRANIELALVRHEADVLVRSSEQRFRRVVSNISDALVIDDEHAQITLANDRFFELFDAPQGITTLESHLAPEWRPAFRRHRDLAGSAATELECEGLKSDGTRVWLEIRTITILDDGGLAVGTQSVLRDITERKQAQDALREHERLLAESQRVAALGSWKLDLESGDVTWTEQTFRLYGQSPGSFVPNLERVLGLVHPDDRSAKRAWIDAACTSPPRPLDFRVTWPDGSVHVLQGRGELVGSSTSAAALVGTVQDVSAERRHTAALTALSTGLVSSGASAFFEDVTAHLAEVLEAEVAFVSTLRVGEPTTLRTLALTIDGELQPPMEYTTAGTPCERVIRDRCAVVIADDVQRSFPDDEELVELGARSYGAIPLLGEGGVVLGHVGIIARRPLRDPERVESLLRMFAIRSATEIERQRVEARFASLFEFAPDAVLLIDSAGKIVLANHMAEETLGYSVDELVGLDVEALVPASERETHPRLRRTYLGEPIARRMGMPRARVSALRKDGQQVPVEIGLSPLLNDDGTLVVAVVRDVSERVRAEAERRQLESAMQQSQKLEALGTLAGGIAHDFNNLLAAITANVELARLKADPGGATAERLEAAIEAATRAKDLIKRILTFSRKQPTTYTVVSLDVVVDEVIKLLRATLPRGVALRLEKGSTAPSVRCDRTQILQVLMNLGTNAWQAMGGGTGTITIRLDGATIGDEATADLCAGDYARLEVSDDGNGMDPSTLARIFEPFFTTKPVGQGTGLGLSVSHGIVTSHGGVIRARSTEGEGTTFSIYLPAAPTADAREGSEAPSRAATRVLVIDDDTSFARLTEEMLRQVGYQATSFESATEAIDALEADPWGFDIVLTDLNMPTITGVQVARLATELRPDLPVVVTSGNQRFTREDLSHVNVRYTIDKPYTLAELHEVLERALANP